MSTIRGWLDRSSAAERDELAQLIVHPWWSPDSVPQLEALLSPADVLGYGGAAGGGKSDLLLGAALTRHRRAIIYRREGTQLEGLEERARELLEGHGRYNASKKIWRLADGQILRFGAVKDAESWKKYQGRAFDFIGFDEAAHFLELQVRMLLAWLRTTEPGQPTRAILAFNPPTDAEGLWVIQYFGPWLDAHHPNPAGPGEIRWFVSRGGKDFEVAGPDPVNEDGRLLVPRSRSFIPARTEDNRHLNEDYLATLDMLPEPLRSLFRHGDMNAAQEDDAWQVIPTSWVRAAQARWRREAGARLPMDALGADIARGGRDRTIVTPRHGAWFGEQIVVPGVATPDGPKAAGLILASLRDAAPIHVDIIGIGGAVYDFLESNRVHVVGINGAARSGNADRSGKLRFANLRAELWWRLREELDPVHGTSLALPPDRELLADLCAPRWKLTGQGILIEGKEDLMARLGRSPDKGDSLVYASVRTPKRLADPAGLIRRDYDPFAERN